MEQQRPVTNVILRYKEKQNVEDFAMMLETIAKKLKEQGKFIFVQNGEEIEVQPGPVIKTEIEYTQKGDKHSFEIEFDWYEGRQTEQGGKMEIR
ncbi:amphi-Trp domain-containing protein [Anaerobacillus sp. MEB173]|uniref:amphi-Trp domain-containing protein n=1 Tax=Anaerobacillus sp. MEB173 TaxID=3383345 RepID=UPI003F90919D